MNPWNSVMQLREKLLDLGVGDLSVFGNQTTFELDVRLDGIHQRRIAERENAPKELLADRRTDLPGGRSDDGGRAPWQADD
jgi:hypothetical protein